METTLSFTDENIGARWVTDALAYPVDLPTIVVNTSTKPIHYSGGVEGILAPWKSTILQRTVIREASSLVTLRMIQMRNIGGIVLAEQWRWFGADTPTFPRRTPLYISTQDTIGQVNLSPRQFTRQSNEPIIASSFDVKVNLWFTPEQTDCVIHTGHTFLEVHTQLFGTGHMQKFFDNDERTLYEDVYMPPGFTHDPFPTINSDEHYNYPWHRYFADSDCIWMAIELHRQI
jgi:hypothetical protein